MVDLKAVARACQTKHKAYTGNLLNIHVDFCSKCIMMPMTS